MIGPNLGMAVAFPISLFERPIYAVFVMSHTLIALIGAAYLWIAVEQYNKDSIGVALMFLGYAVAQGGVWMQAK